MQRTLVSTLPTRHGEEVRVCGLVATKRILKRVIFLVLQDRTGRVQVTVERSDAPTALEETAMALTPGSAVEVRGEAMVNPAVRAGGLELVAREIVEHSLAEPELPIGEESSPELQLDWRFLALRSPRNRLIFEVQTTIERAMRAWWGEHGFIELHSPKLMHSASESGSETFSTPYFELGRA
ncbi:MAG TPA: OB-fold nucleic acid binding domain-containing protein, partial [Gemmatimonadaceae bacterium]|nr:OB-fold nucleic acid binding domain-containing protein [Gemmatimonadaceae bacterium]